MGRAPCCDKMNVKRGPWSPEEDAKLKEYIEKCGTGGNWIALPQKAGLRRCGKSCRLRWLNYLRPNIKHGEFSDDEDRIIYTLFASIGSRWSIIAAQLPGRTDNDIKNYWNTKLKKKLMGMVPSPQKRPHQATTYPSLSLLQTPSPPLLSSPSLSFKSSNNNFYNTATPPRSFTGYEHISIPSTLLNTTSSSLLQITQDSYVGPIHNYQVKDNNVLMFGGEASCSSSDGSCKEVEFDQYGVSNYLYNGIIEENQKSMASNGGKIDEYSEKQNGFYGENPLDYNSLEEIKQLISTNFCSNLNFPVDENKREEKVMYY